MLIRTLVAASPAAPSVALGTMRFLPPLLGEVPEGRWGLDPVQRLEPEVLRLRSGRRGEDSSLRSFGFAQDDAVRTRA